jgi:phosphatidylserine/phosphatidylglycerophosphate/cardiolipin synthase-like enzyme
MATESSALIRDLDPSMILRIARLLIAGEVDCNSTIADLSDTFRLPEPKLRSLKRLLNSSKGPEGTSASEWLGMCLLALAKQRELFESQSGIPEIVTSGSGWVLGARDTRGVILEMIRSARTEILLVVYTATEGAREIVEALAEKAKEGLNIILLAEKEMDVATSILHMWPSGAPRPPVFLDNSDAIARKVHGKVLVIDRHDLLVTSANLTHLGLDVNLEIGIRIRGRPADRIAEGIVALCRSGSVQQAV